MVTQEFGPFDQAMSGPPTVFLVFFGVVATLVVGTFVFTAVRLVSQRRADNAAPLLSVDAMVVSRRTDDRSNHGSSTSYFVTFEEPSGERRELQVGGRDYGRLAEGDRGHLMHQGTRYQGFTRDGAVDGIR